MAIYDLINYATNFKYLDLVFAIVILLVALVFVRVAHYILVHVLKKRTEITESELDDNIISIIEKPIFMGIILFGSQGALFVINFLKPFMNVISNIFSVTWILWGVYIAIKLIDTTLCWYVSNVKGRTERKFDTTFVPILRRIVNIFIYVSATIILLRHFGIEITPLLAGLGVGGLAIALAMKDTLTNLFAGAYLITEGSVRIGDYIELEDGTRGIVTDVGWRSCKIKPFNNNMVILPNAKLADGKIINYQKPAKMTKVPVKCGVSYKSDLDKVERVAVDVAKKIMKRLGQDVDTFEPFVRFKEFGNSNINFSVILQVKVFTDRFELKHEFIKALKKRFDKEGIEISYPTRDVYMRK